MGGVSVSFWPATARWPADLTVRFRCTAGIDLETATLFLATIQSSHTSKITHHLPFAPKKMARAFWALALVNWFGEETALGNQPKSSYDGRIGVNSFCD
jgi:hypothetical protein